MGFVCGPSFFSLTARAARREHDLHLLVGDPGLELGDDLLELVAHDGSRDELMPRLFEALGEHGTAAVVFLGAGVGHGHHRDAYGLELTLAHPRTVRGVGLTA